LKTKRSTFTKEVSVSGEHVIESAVAMCAHSSAVNKNDSGELKINSKQTSLAGHEYQSKESSSIVAESEH